MFTNALVMNLGFLYKPFFLFYTYIIIYFFKFVNGASGRFRRKEFLYGGRSVPGKLGDLIGAYGLLNGGRSVLFRFFDDMIGGRPALPGGVYFGISYGGSELP